MCCGEVCTVQPEYFTGEMQIGENIAFCRADCHSEMGLGPTVRKFWQEYSEIRKFSHVKVSGSTCTYILTDQVLW